MILFYVVLNAYLHCGYVVWWVEAVLAPCGVLTSNWHNTHHNRGRRGFYAKDQTFSEGFASPLLENLSPESAVRRLWSPDSRKVGSSGSRFIFWDVAMGTYPAELVVRRAKAS